MFQLSRKSSLHLQHKNKSNVPTDNQSFRYLLSDIKSCKTLFTCYFTCSLTYIPLKRLLSDQLDSIFCKEITLLSALTPTPQSFHLLILNPLLHIPTVCLLSQQLTHLQILESPLVWNILPNLKCSLVFALTLLSGYSE